MGKLRIDKEKLMAEYNKAKLEYDNYNGLHFLREIPMIRYCNLKYYFDNIIIDKEIIESFMNKIKEDIKFAKEHDMWESELKLIETYNTHRFVLSISEEVLLNIGGDKALTA